MAIAYLAGAIDSDGSIGIKKSTYQKRVTLESTNATYSERVMLKQVTPQIPHILKETFGGYLRLENPSCKKNGKPLWTWQGTDIIAANACQRLLPYLRVKKRQAEVALELRATKDDSRYRQLAYWWEKDHPNWREMEMITTKEACDILGLACSSAISLSVRNGSILALPWDHIGVSKPRVCKEMVLAYAEHQNKSRDKRGRIRPVPLIEWRERLFQEVRELNKMGVHGTSVYHKTGCHAPA